MKKRYLTVPGVNFLLNKPFKTLIVFALALLISLNCLAHRVETYSYGCVTPGQSMQIDAIVVQAPFDTWYQWQYRDNSGIWKCFVNGVNVINGVNFTVSGATSQNVENDAPLLTISNATTSLEDVLVRVLMREGADPCGAPPGTTYGGDDLGPDETKYLRLHVFGNSSVCPPNAYLCDGNILFNVQGHYGGFENKTYDVGTDSYTSNNFGPGIASSDYTFGPHGAGHYQDVNNPFSVYIDFGKNIAPHTGNFQLVVQGTADIASRAWYKTVSLLAGATYSFDVFAARVDDSDPIVTLKVNGTTIQSGDLSVQPIGNWVRIAGQYRAATTGDYVISIGDSRPGGLNAYTLDDICFRQCFNCSTLPLHNLELSAHLQGDIVGLKWTAENEMNTHQFVIERSTDGVSYSDVGSKPASGQTNTLTEYTSSDDIHSLSTENIIYYRIRAIDGDGRFAYSNVATVRLSKKAGVYIWPSPFRDNISITYNAASNTSIDISIINSAGRIVKQNIISVSRGLNQVSVTNLGSLSTGIYFIRITDRSSSETYLQKLTK